MLENSLHSSSTKRTGSPRGEKSRSYYYERLMQVSIRNTFYNASGDLCPDFQIRPTSESSALMLSLGLLFKNEGSGFSVLLDKLREQEFLRYLSSQVSGWTRLSFMLTLKNPYFFNFTDIPIDMSPATRTFYLSNTEARTTADDKVLLNPRAAKDRIPVAITGSQYRETVGPNSKRVLVQDISGDVVMCQPVFWPRHDPRPLQCSPEGGTQTSFYGPADMVRRNPIYLDFSLLPEGKYQIEECENTTGDCVASSLRSSGDEVVYAFSGRPLFFIDLLFTNPGISGGVYPIRNPGDRDGDVLVPTQYYLDFERRSTIWNYYIVSTGAPLKDLRIDTIAPQSSPVTFTGPTSVELPGNQKAALFVSNSAIPLQEQSGYNFQLLGRAGGVEMRNGVLMNRLPVASSQQVIPGAGNYATSEPAPGKPADLQPGKNFSDIYVYV